MHNYCSVFIMQGRKHFTPHLFYQTGLEALVQRQYLLVNKSLNNPRQHTKNALSSINKI